MYITILTDAPNMPRLTSLEQYLEAQGASVVQTVVLPVANTLKKSRSAIRLTLSAASVELTFSEVRAKGLEDGVDANLQSAADRSSDIKLAVFDMDSTLIACEVIDELANRAGVGGRVSDITERAMRGELDFNESFAERLGLLKGLDVGIAREIAKDLPYSDGVRELMLTLRARRIKTVILSGGFDIYAQHLVADLGMDDYLANTLEVSEGRLTGRVIPPIINADAKEARLRELARDMGISLAQTMAVGDGANDLKMLGAAGIGIAYRAKPLVREQARYQLTRVGLDGALYLLGSRGEFD